MFRRAFTSALAILVVATPFAAGAQGGNPFEGDRDAIRVGRPLYEANCADCHSADARGVQGPDLTELWATGGDDQRVFDAVRNGIEGSVMPPSQAADDEIWAVVAYLRSISTVPPFDTSSGDAAVGRQIFDDECSRCHLVHGNGGGLGPDLSMIAQVRSREALVRSIRDPDDTVAAGFRTVTLVTGDGTRVEGINKSEDAFSIQVIDLDGRLQGYTKANLRTLRNDDDSPMPRFGRARLSESELDDLIAFLGTLRAPESQGP